MATIETDLNAVRGRADFFLKVAEMMLSECSFKSCGLILTEMHALAAAECYFLINSDYKRRKMLNPASPTEFAKVSAITSLVFCSLDPIRGNNNADFESIYVNCMFSMRIGCSLVGHDFSKRSFEDKLFQYNWLRNQRLDFALRYGNAIMEGSHNIGEPYDGSLSQDDIEQIEKVTLDFRILGQLGPYTGRRD